MRIATAILIAATLGAGVAAASNAVLPRNVVVGLSVVQKYFAEVTREQYSGSNSTAVGNPAATRSVFFVNADGSKKVTLSVDRYASNGAALTAYREAVGKSKLPGFSPLTVPTIGQSTFAGRLTRGAETHVGMGALDGNLIVGATLAGFAASKTNINNLVSLARIEEATAKRALSAGGHAK